MHQTQHSRFWTTVDLLDSWYQNHTMQGSIKSIRHSRSNANAEMYTIAHADLYD